MTCFHQFFDMVGDMKLVWPARIPSHLSSLKFTSDTGGRRTTMGLANLDSSEQQPLKCRWWRHI